ncbi:hypothetical protein [Thalassolituus maritimus]|uniref:DUF4440 domain-containing protein n=1 Tax=Thalassolituus maritimus TaxID=484498 RepID=A0ABQ0A3F4_9GAMM
MLKDIPSKVYEGISFSKGSMPDFELLKSCFIEQGIFINNKGENPIIKPVLDYVSMIENNIENGNILSIQETEISQNIQVFGNVAQISSDYELVFEGKQSSQVRYGVNLFQVINNNGQWLVSSMCWDDRNDKSLLSNNV